jgi:hypothetical protein
MSAVSLPGVVPSGGDEPRPRRPLQFRRRTAQVLFVWALVCAGVAALGICRGVITLGIWMNVPPGTGPTHDFYGGIARCVIGISFAVMAALSVAASWYFDRRPWR